ncbi:hypothetical protein FOC1_g10014195 [Fusarium oxysporum f. sp. cubense race 1]|uniref:Uncharacterized protein n=1 Tax=Fusarium oxysporum f. sp. cubense (strain race 1) TaxID=1229664 RepID=N4UAJ9_FUSC1|nr:hypothetical protein FOC1_g10014195 [Fusarium oxysporum f. sp. cubense race 1]
MSTNSDAMPGITLHLSAADLEQLFDRKLKEVLDEALQPIHSKLDAIEEKLEKLTARVGVVEGLTAKIPNMEDDLRSQE